MTPVQMTLWLVCPPDDFIEIGDVKKKHSGRVFAHISPQLEIPHSLLGTF